MPQDAPRRSPKLGNRLRALVLLGTPMLLAGAAQGHGGVYRGPGATIPPGGAAPTGGAPSPTVAGGGAAVDSWSTWWGFNREPYLDLRAAVRAGGTMSREQDFYLGAGERSQTDGHLAPPPDLLHGRVVPALLRALEVERDNDLVTALLIALAKIGAAPPELEHADRDLEAVLAGFLDDANQEIAESAALALGILQGDEQVFVLAELIDDGPAGRRRVGGRAVPHRTRAFAAFGLGLVGMRTEREDVRRFVVQRLVKHFEADAGRKHDLRVACLLALANVPLALPAEDEPAADDTRPHPASSRAGQIRFAIDVLFDDDLPRTVRAHAPYALGRLARGAPPALRARVLTALTAPLQPFAKDPIEVEVGCVQALAATADADSDPVDAAAREALRRQIEGGQLIVRHEALIALARVATRPGTGVESGATLRAARSDLLRLLSRAKTLSRPWVALALGLLERDADRFGQGASTDSLQALRSLAGEAATPDVVGGACIALGLVPDPAATSILVRRLEDLSDDVARGHAAIGLGLLGARSAGDTLRDIVRDSRYRPALLRDAAIGLGLLGDKELVPELVDMLREAESLATQASISAALGTIGDVRAVDALLDLLADDEVTARARAFAAAALGTLGSKHRLPWNSRFSQDVNYLAPTETLYDPASGRGLLDIF